MTLFPPPMRRLALFGAVAMVAAAQQPAVLDTMVRELNRNFSALQEKAKPAPYFIGYEVTDLEQRSITASFGALADNSGSHSRLLDVSVRVGSPKLDNYHVENGDRGSFTSGRGVAVDDTPRALEMRLWGETDRVYRAAVDRLIRLQSNQQVKVAAEDQSDDFSTETPVVHASSPVKFHCDQAGWTGRLRPLSARFAKYPEVLTSTVGVSCRAETHYLATTEGTRLVHGRGYARVVIQAHARAEDGSDLSIDRYFDSGDESGLPGDDAIARAIDRAAADLVALLHAPETEPYTGPAILGGQAAGVFFHEIFGHRVEGERQKDESEGQTFAKSLGKSVLPEFLSVVFDPTRHRFGETELNGWYDYDSEGVPAQKVGVVERGILKGFLLSRSPIREFPHSNGHGRREPGREVYSRQSNLIVEADRTVPDAQLRRMLIDEIKKRGKPYGLFFREVQGGFTNTQRTSLQAFRVMPILVDRVYADGRPDELVRGANIVGTPLASFAGIAAAGDKPEVFNGYCGAASGWLPVSAISPALLVSEIEVEKKPQSKDRPPLLPAPVFHEVAK
jgi:predicted Zn-dependent protease